MKSSNASASAFGWDFQSNAAIMLMLKNIEKASKVKVEGKSEDVEITFADGKILMSQVKAVVTPDDYSHVKEKLDAGLRTLNNAAKSSDVEQLVFITNSPNPFNDTTTMFKFSSPINIVPFSERGKAKGHGRGKSGGICRKSSVQNPCKYRGFERRSAGWQGIYTFYPENRLYFFYMSVKKETGTVATHGNRVN